MHKVISRKLKIAIITIAVVVILGLSVGVNYLIRINEYQSMAKNITYSDIDISTIPDGNYIGSCNIDFVVAKVQVSIQSGKITEVSLIEHKQERGKPAEKVIDDVITKQQIDVDEVAGATNSSKVIKKAIENALQNTN